MTARSAGVARGAPSARSTRLAAIGAPLARGAAGLAPVILVIGGWWLVALLLDRPRVYAPPNVVFDDLVDIAKGHGQIGSTYADLGATLLRLAAAFGISIVLGVLLGIAAGRIRLAFSLVENLVWVFMAVPSIVWVFIFAVALGISNFVPIAALVALLTPMILVNVAEGAKSVPVDIVEMARSYKVTAWQRLTGVFLPFLVPYIASSARTAFALGIKLVVIAEVVGLSNGIGYELSYWYERLFMGPVIAWGVVMIAVGLVVDYAIFGPLERRVGRWRGRPSAEAPLGGAE